MSAQKHKRSQSQSRATVTLKTFGQTRIDVQLFEQKHRDTSQWASKKKREVLKRLIDSAVYFGKQELAFRGHYEGTNCLQINF